MGSKTRNQDNTYTNGYYLVKKGDARMPTDLGRAYSLDWRGTPTQMLATDIPVWYRFLEKWGSGFHKLYYNCLLGGPFLTEEEKKEPLKRMWRTNLSKRADAIAELENEVWIIEVARNPGLRALGQLQVYRSLWLTDPKIVKIEKMILVAEMIDPDILHACGTFGILTFIMA